MRLSKHIDEDLLIRVPRLRLPKPIIFILKIILALFLIVAFTVSQVLGFIALLVCLGFIRLFRCVAKACP